MSESMDYERTPRFGRTPFDRIAAGDMVALVKGLIPVEGVGYLAGPSGSYKTFLALDWSLRIARGEKVLDRLTRRAGVVYIASEAPKGVARRIEAWRRDSGAEGLPFHLIDNAPDIRDAGQIEELIAELEQAADDFRQSGERLGLVVIDTLAASMPGGDENAGADMSAVLANVSRIARALAVFVLIVSHTGKDETRGLRGWSGQHAGADVVIMLTRESQDGGGEIRVGKVAKLKDGEDGQRFAIALKPVVLGFDEDGDEVSSAVVLYEKAPDSGTKGPKSRLNAAAVLVLNGLHRLEDEGQTRQLPLVPGVRLGTSGARVEALRDQVFKMGLREAEAPAEDAPKIERDRWLNSRRKGFQRALDDLSKAGKVRHEAGWVWPL